jgi:hypothetical protein
MAALGRRPIAKVAWVDQVVVRLGADDFPEPCQARDRDSHPSASADGAEEHPAGRQERRPPDAHPHSEQDAHQAAGPPEVARVVAVAKVVDQEQERPASMRHLPVQAPEDAAERWVARQAAPRGALQAPEWEQELRSRQQ